MSEAGAERAPARAAVAGASGYVGGELLRLLGEHPGIVLVQASSERNAGSAVHFTHPHLRGRNELRFVPVSELEPCDLLFMCLPHGRSMGEIARFAELAPRIVDLSSDFRLRSAARYERWYGAPHAAPEWLERFVYGLPELGRERLRGSTHASGVGCNATASILSLLPFLGKETRELIDWSRGAVIEVKVGSSEGGAAATEATHHPIRAGVVRSFAPTGHRHTAEIEQALEQAGIDAAVHLSATAIERVRGVLATTHLFVRDGVSERDLFAAYRSAAAAEPFVRLVKERRGLYRYPEPKLLSGTNYADIGFELDPSTRRLVSLCAIDNLMKGAAGSAVQCANLMLGWDEGTALGFGGLHPV
ncbi:MAG TPA: N-acetyl-gamma-glutamyl-phosphate reductase [Thermoanaerobaculia bacterium]|nr:N-acetyl-gamma-glutamyl-phosphate reductase [Thermoanaerobaculia bacterium]